MKQRQRPSGVRPEPAQRFYAHPVVGARILAGLFLAVMALGYAAACVVLPFAEAVALLGPLLPLVGVGVLGEVVLAFVLSWRSPIGISDSGMTLTDFWGRTRTMTWGEVGSVTPARLLSVPYLKVSSLRAGRPDFLLPLAVTRPQAYRDAIRYSASPIHPVRRYIEDDETGPR